MLLHNNKTTIFMFLKLQIKLNTIQIQYNDLGFDV